VVGVGVKSCTAVLLEGHFLFTCSDTFAAGYVLYRIATMHNVTDRIMLLLLLLQTDGLTTL